ncbi:hypothetical protein BBJ28_00015351 [Nothophytophthora sp. Chile5]|nr:hypothetical protein BBJ28_00015351 [Nothophytophthora sp. Chile5]
MRMYRAAIMSPELEDVIGHLTPSPRADVRKQDGFNRALASTNDWYTHRARWTHWNCLIVSAEVHHSPFEISTMVAAVNYKWVLISGDISHIEVELFLDRQKRREKTCQHEPCQKVKEKFKPSRILNVMIDSRQRLGIPASPPFGFTFSTDEFGKPTLSRGTAQRPVVVGCTTKTMLRNLVYAKDYVLHVDGDFNADATFKLNTSGFPSIIIGVSNVRRQFHPVAFFVVSDIRQSQLETVFHHTFNMYQTETENIASIGCAMADADVAQQNAFEAVVTQELKQAEPPVYLMCFLHVMQNVWKYIASVPPALHRKIHKQVYRIHYARSELDLDRRIAEAVSEWKSDPALRDFERRFSQQWLAGRFTRWQCLAIPAGFAKTNNPVEQFNKEIKRDYSLRSLLSINALAQAYVDMCHHRSCRATPFDTSLIPSSEQARRYRQLEKGGRLSVSSHHRASVAFLMEGNERQIIRVFQSGFNIPKPTRKKRLTTKEEVDRADQDDETDGQPTKGWIVDVDASACPYRNMFKLGFCVHLIAARLHQGLPVEGVQTKRTFEIKGKTQGKGRRADVALALAKE